MDWLVSRSFAPADRSSLNFAVKDQFSCRHRKHLTALIQTNQTVKPSSLGNSVKPLLNNFAQGFHFHLLTR